MTAPVGTPIFGTPQVDQLVGTNGTDIMIGGLGDDVLDGAGGEDVASYVDAPSGITVTMDSFFRTGNVTGGDGHDLLLNIEDIYGSQFNDNIKGDDGANYMAGFGGNDTIDGDAGNDRLYGGNGNDSISGGADNDIMEGGAGNDTIDGGTGTSDTVGFSGKILDYTVTYDVEFGTYTLTDKTANRDGTDKVSHVQNFKFSDGTLTGAQLLAAADDKTAPTISSTTPANAAVGVSVTGDITVTFSEPIVLGSGSVVLKDADGKVVASYSAVNTANVSVSGSTLTIHFNNALTASSNYSLELGAGSVRDLAGNSFAGSLDYHFTTGGNGVTQTAGASNPNLTGTANDDTLIAGPGNGTLDGGAGDDVLLGGTGKTLMKGGLGSDTLISGAGADTMQGGDGGDLYYVNDTGDIVEETQANAQQIASGGHDADLGRSLDKVIASISYSLTNFVENLSLATAAGNLAGSGNELNNVLSGNEGNNVLNGKAGNDTVDGGAGVDTAQYSGKYNDYKVNVGGAGSNTSVADTRANANGGEGNDTLSNMERLQFSDLRLAMDLGATQAGGKTVLMMAVATSLGPAFVSAEPYAGLFLGYFDTGASLLDGANLLISAGIVAAFAGGTDNASLVKMVYNNVNGHAPDAATLASLVAPLTAGTITQAQWMADMAASTANQTHVNLVGFAGSGLQFTV